MRRGTWLALLAVLVAASRTGAQEAFGRPLALRVPASTVALGLGNAGLLLTDADVLFYNPAMLPNARGVAASAQRYGAAGTTVSMASVQALGSISVALGARLVDGSTDAGAYGSALDPGLSRLAAAGSGRLGSLALTAAAARQVGPVRVGLGATYVRESLRSELEESALVDVGAMMPLGPVTVALAVQHLGAAVELPGTRVDQPWRAVTGVGSRAIPLGTWFDLSAVAQVAVDGAGFVEPAGGAELAYVPLEGVALALRAGAKRPRADDEGHFSGGFGVSLDRYSLDYAVEPFRGGVTTHRLGVRIR